MAPLYPPTPHEVVMRNVKKALEINKEEKERKAKEFKDSYLKGYTAGFEFALDMLNIYIQTVSDGVKKEIDG